MHINYFYWCGGNRTQRGNTMKKISTVFLILTLFSFGMSYSKFKKHTLKHSNVLQSKALSIQTTKVKNNLSLRTQNPEVNMEISKYNPKFSSSAYGYAISASQRIRTNRYYNALKDKAYASKLLQEAYVYDGKAGFLRILETLYTNYVYESKLLTLLQDEYKLSRKVSNIVKERYENGSETKVAYLQAKTDALTLKAEMHTTKQAMNSLYYQLLAIGGFKKKISLSKKFIYPVGVKVKNKKHLTSKQKILHAKEKLLLSQMHMNESSINAYTLQGGIEKEPDQSIIRLSISIPLPIRNNKEEEKVLARLQMQQLKLDNAQLEIDSHAKKQMLQASINELFFQYKALTILKREQKSLNALLLEGYKIAQGSIFEMMNSKNRLIQTKKALLQTQKMINTQTIELRFIQGDYND